MKKSGFTLAELIITLTIIGVIAAIVAPSMSNLVPDKNKAKILRYHTQIENAINDIMSDETLNQQHTVYDKTTYEYSLSCEGIACVNNFSNILKEKLGVSARSDGSTWTVSNTEITIDLDPNKAGSTKFSSTSTKSSEIDTYSFKISSFGDVTAGDPLTDAYLRNPMKMNDKKTDFDYAKKNKDKKY